MRSRREGDVRTDGRRRRRGRGNEEEEGEARGECERACCCSLTGETERGRERERERELKFSPKAAMGALTKGRTDVLLCECNAGGEDEDGDVQKMPLHTFDFLT